MPSDAWSLLVFTLLSQTSVGGYFVVEFLNSSYAKEFSCENLNPLRFFSRLFVLSTAIIAGVSSIFHLKKWAHAYHAFNNLKTSWVGKEMMLFFLFLCCVVLLTFMSWRKIEAGFPQRFISIAGVFCGTALIFSMAKIYMLPTVPVWNTWTTPSFFFTATVLLGSLAAASLYTAFLSSPKSSSLMENIRERWNRKTLPNILKLVLISLVSGILTTGFFVIRSIAIAEEYGAETSIMSPDKQILFSFRIFFLVLGGILLLLYMKKSRHLDGFQKKSQNLVYRAFIFITLAEMVGRYLFYVSFYRIGL